MYEVKYRIHVRTTTGEKITSEPYTQVVDAEGVDEARKLLLEASAEVFGERTPRNGIFRLGPCEGGWVGDVTVNTRHVVLMSVRVDSVNLK